MPSSMSSGSSLKEALVILLLDRAWEWLCEHPAHPFWLGGAIMHVINSQTTISY